MDAGADLHGRLGGFGALYTLANTPTDEEDQQDQLSMARLLVDAGVDPCGFPSHSPLDTARAAGSDLLVAFLTDCYRQRARELLVELCIGVRALDWPVLVTLQVYDCLCPNAITKSNTRSTSYVEWEVAKIVKHWAQN